MIEGYERQQLSQRVALMSLLRQVPLTAQMIQMDNGADQQIDSAIQQSIEQEEQAITQRHKDTLVDVKPAEIKQANAFKAVFEARKNLREGGK
ncbi:MAG: hypothetical protein LKJ72_01140 [[Lactobacillus] timonensis]|jgi:hypothetical protein|uniref:hypothetical protein n=1 Tax=[Lactobacillus] timonensis TaxID=1970790 RepID=UPI0023577B06|nr:hypothetical protein [[Lactobacillus] timonensis]MCI1925612.1 hypothetical protein [[Lactobacillus] timonensis]MCI1956971.1 hypothetical protein [[Lactobacillus] timonensis]MCI1970073.1 hypothetical protein [[Lactobacillus] timonensis]MCI2006162.1 hypothetical protein [[Lactobacillus] timonensis]